MKKFIYQDPRRPRVKSRPIDEDDVKSRQVLEGGGWRVVETIDDEAVSPETVTVGDEVPAPPEPVQPAAEPKKGKRTRGKKPPAPPEA